MDRKFAMGFLFFLVLVFSSYFCFSQYEFVENKGQWQDNVLYKMPFNNGALFLENNCLTYTFVDSQDLHNSPAHHSSEYSADKLLKKAHAYKVRFLNSNPNPVLTADFKNKDYCNFFIGKDQSKWASNVAKFSLVKYIDIYRNIDLEYFANSNLLKYNFVVNVGGQVNDIELEYQGADKISLVNGDLIIQTSVNIISEIRPYAFQLVDGDTIAVSCSFNLKRNKLKFNIGEYDKEKDLIIDPYLVFSTYTGSLGDNWGFTATWDYNDNVFSGGVVFDIGYPVSVGAYQIDFAGGTPPIPGGTSNANGCDIGIIKYNSDGTQRLYATYLGGSLGQEMPHSLVVTEKNELLIMGTTGSSDFPTSANAFQTDFAGGDNVVYDNIIGFGNGVDIFIAKLSGDGQQLLASTYVGGSKNDGLNFKNYYNTPISGVGYVLNFGNDSIYGNYADGARGEIVVDSKSYVYVGTNTFSSDFPQGINPAYQPSSAGEQEGIVFKMNPDLSQMVWSSYLGGSQDDAIFSISLTENEEVIIAGTTVSTDFPTTAGAYNTTFNGGNTDGFVAKLNNNGNQLLASSYFGSNKYDNVHFVRADKHNNIFICGQTKAPGTTLVHNANYYVANSGQFIAKFNPSLDQLIWSTVFGSGNGRPNISISAFDVDLCNRVFLTGWGREWPFMYYNANSEFFTWASLDFGTKGMQVTSDAIQSETDGQDFYILVLSEDANELEYASFFGELNYAACSASGRDHVDGGTSRFDRKGSIVQSVCASCGACQGFPTYPPNVWSSQNMSSNCNNAVFKIKIIDNISNANFDPVPIGCIPYTVNFNNNSQAVSYHWDFGDGTSSTQENPSHVYTVGGEYVVTLIAYHPNTCNLYDTISRIVTVIEPGEKFMPDITICENQSIIIGPDGDYPEGSTFVWVGEGLNNYNIKNPVASPSITTDYVLTVTGVCNDIVHQKVLISEADFDLSVSPDVIICQGESTTLSAYNSFGLVDTWFWSTDPEFNNIISNEQTLVVSPSETGIYYVMAKENLCDKFQVAQVQVTVYEFNYILAPSFVICPGETTNLTIVNQNPSDNLSYQWSPSSQIISGANTNSPLVGPSISTTYYVTVTNSLGCESTAQTELIVDEVSVEIIQVIDNLCYGDCNGKIIVNANGIPPFSFVWSNGENGNQISGLCAGEYSVSLTDMGNCEAENSAVVSQPDELIINFQDVVHPICDGQSFGKATAIVSGGTAPYQYLWSNGGANQATNSACVQGDNFVTVTDAKGCEKVEKIILDAPSDFSLSLFTEMLKCFGDCDASASVELINGVSPFVFSWSNGSNQESISELCVGEYSLSVKDSDDCVLYKYFEITEPEKLLVNLQVKDKIFCHGKKGSISSNVSGGTAPYTYIWSNGLSSELISDLGAGTYSLIVTDNNNCVQEGIIDLTQPDALLMSPTIVHMICSGVCNGQIIPNISGGVGEYSYLWSDGSTSKNLENLCQGDYSLTVTDVNNCKVENHFRVNNLEYTPDLIVSANSELVYEGEIFYLFAVSSEQGSYAWDNQDLLSNSYIPNPTASIYEDVIFHITFVDEFGCVATDSIKIFSKEVVCGEPYIFVPNAFTPNDDGNNDYFKPYFPINLVDNLYFAVFDRWGGVVFESHDPNMKGWDGRFKNEKLSTDVFVYLLKVKCLNGEEYTKKGNVTLLK